MVRQRQMLACQLVALAGAMVRLCVVVNQAIGPFVAQDRVVYMTGAARPWCLDTDWQTALWWKLVESDQHNLPWTDD